MRFPANRHSSRAAALGDWQKLTAVWRVRANAARPAWLGPPTKENPTMSRILAAELTLTPTEIAFLTAMKLTAADVFDGRGMSRAGRENRG